MHFMRQISDARSKQHFGVEERYGHAASALPSGEGILVTHGYKYDNGPQWLEDTYLYDSVNKKWLLLEGSEPEGTFPDVPHGRFYSQLALLNHSHDEAWFILHGGDDGNHKADSKFYKHNALDEVWLLRVEHTLTKTWFKQPTLLPKYMQTMGRSQHCQFVHEGVMHVLLGLPANEPRHIMLDTRTWQWSANQPSSDEKHGQPANRYGFGCAFDEGAGIVVIGAGFSTDHSKPNLDDVWQLSLHDNSWHYIGKLRQGGRGGVMSAWSHEFGAILAGGCQCQPICKCTFGWASIRRDPSNERQWHITEFEEAKATKRFRGSLSETHDGRLLLFGGEGFEHAHDYHSDVWQLTHAAPAWVPYALGAFSILLSVVMLVMMCKQEVFFPSDDSKNAGNGNSALLPHRKAQKSNKKND